MRRKIVRKTKPSTAQDDKKLQGALKKLNVQPIPGVEEVNMFREDGNVLHFSTPKGTPRVHPYPIHLPPIPSSPLHTILSTICRSLLVRAYGRVHTPAAQGFALRRSAPNSPCRRYRLIQ